MSIKGADSHKVNVRSFFKYTAEISERQLSVMLTFRILISLPRRIWDLDRFFLLMLLMATSQSVFCGEQRAERKERFNDWDDWSSKVSPWPIKDKGLSLFDDATHSFCTCIPPEPFSLVCNCRANVWDCCCHFKDSAQACQVMLCPWILIGRGGGKPRGSLLSQFVRCT